MSLVMKRFYVLPLLLLLCACGGSERQGAMVDLSGFPAQQQTTDYTCGCVSARMVAGYYKAAIESEQELAVRLHTHVDSDTPGAEPGTAVKWTDHGTSVGEIYRYFAERQDFRVVASSYRPADSLPMLGDEAMVGAQAAGNVGGQFEDYGQAARFFKQQLAEGRPVMVCWNMWGGHWTVCVGYDDRGTADFYDDDLLTMADPYDSTDGVADGFTSVGLVAFFYDWFCTMTPKPWQMQPYIVVEPAVAL